MNKVLIIGSSGFVAGHLANELKNNDYVCYGADLNNEINKEKFDTLFKLDITKELEVEKLLSSIKPDYIVNLAAVSSVKKSWEIPKITFEINVNGTINILEAVKKLELKSRILLIGSSEEYGLIDYSNAISEEAELNSINPYGISKITQEKMAKLYNEAFGIDVILTRAFNHIGPGQKTGFVVSDFASQLVMIEKGLKEPVIYVGNLEAERDFTDVRDIVTGYRYVMEKGTSGEIYNIGSGEAVSIKSILEMLVQKCKIHVEVKIDRSKFRKVDTPKIICDNSKITKQIGWNREISLEKSLDDILEYWRFII